MIERHIFIALITIPAILTPSHVSAQTQPTVVIPTIEFSSQGTSSNFKITINPNQPFVVGPLVAKDNGFIFNGGTFNPQDELKVNIPISASINPLSQSAIDATVGNIGISSKTLFRLASGRIDLDQINISGSSNADRGLSVGGDNPILTIP
jgi:hypothetical protein